VHEIGAYQSGELERAVNSLLGCLRKAQDNEGNQGDGDLGAYRIEKCAPDRWPISLLCIPYGHPFWRFEEPKRSEKLYIAFEHVALTGGLLLAAVASR
jgi:hypothetical protein